MTDTETAPDFAPTKRPRRVPAAEPPAVTEPPPESAEPPTETGEASVADMAASVAPAAPVAAEAAPADEAPAGPARRGRRAATMPAVTVPWESALPGVRSSEIRAELAMRERHAQKLLAERDRIIADIEAIETVLDSLG